MSLISPSLNSHRQAQQFIRQQQVIVSNRQYLTWNHLSNCQSFDTAAFDTVNDWVMKYTASFRA